ncbi:MAG: NAD(P)-dependent alcohol dehydrogenase [Methanomassiliicoccales archaeon]|jgi:NADPH:quinone reductase-like Zn-dependent oxidoreductase
MKAIVCEKYGPPEALRLTEVERPTPKDNEVLLKVAASSINKADWIYMSGKPFFARLMGIGFSGPKAKIPGADVAGRIEATGKDVKGLKPGDEVFGILSDSGRGAYAEYVCAPEDVLVPKPANVTFEQAAAVPLAALTALNALREQGGIQPGQTVLINGASGGVGTFAVQIAKALGGKVTAVCSPRNVEIAISIGADRVVDYTKQDFAKEGALYDIIIGANGNRSIFDYMRTLNAKGVYVMSGGTGRQIFQSLLLRRLLSRKNGKKVRICSWKLERKNLLLLSELLENGKLKPVVDKRYPLDQVPEAFRYFEDKKARGKVVIVVENDDEAGQRH